MGLSAPVLSIGSRRHSAANVLICAILRQRNVSVGSQNLKASRMLAIQFTLIQSRHIQAKIGESQYPPRIDLAQKMKSQPR